MDILSLGSVELLNWTWLLLTFVLGAGAGILMTNLVSHVTDRVQRSYAPTRFGVVAIIMGFTFSLLLLRFGLHPQLVIYALLASLLCCVALVDIDTYTIPNGLIFAGIVLWAASVWVLPPAIGGCRYASLFEQTLESSVLVLTLDGLLGGLLLGGGVLLFSHAFEQTKKRSSLGGGDVKLLFVAGLFLGVQLGMLSVLLACVFALLMALLPVYSLDARHHSDQGRVELGESSHLEQANSSGSFKAKVVPFGPAISLAIVVTLLIGCPVLTWYVSL